MAKVVSLSDKVIRELDRIKEEEGDISYSKAIDKLISSSSEDLALNEINRRFHEIESLMPELMETWEIMRVLAIHIHKLPPDKKEGYLREVNEKILSIVRYILSLTDENGEREENQE